MKLLIQMDKCLTPFPLFHALGDPTRAAVTARLAEGPATVSQLALPFAMALPALLKHIRVLETAGAIITEKSGRTRLCRLNPAAIRAAETWLAARRRVWEAQADRLQAFLDTGGDLTATPHPGGDPR